MLYDKEIREPLFDYLEEKYGKVRILEEKTMGRSRADIIMVLEDEICGIEIKSDADTYVRLKRQVEDYDKYFDKNIVVVGTSHAMQIHKHVPDYWGIITVEEVDGEADFYTLRGPKENPKRNMLKKMEILWKPELAEILQTYDLPKYKDKSKAFVVKKILEKLPDKILNQQISSLLFERDYTRVEETLKEYRKGEIQKLIEQESDEEKKLALMMLQAEKGRILTKNGFKKARGRRRRKI